MRGITLTKQRRERLNNLLDEKDRSKRRVQKFCIVCAAVALFALCLIPFVSDAPPPIAPPRAVLTVPANMRECPVCKGIAVRSCLTFRCIKGHRFEAPDEEMEDEVSEAEFTRLKEP